MSHVIKINDEVFSLLNDQANEAGLTPELWVELKVKEIALKRRKKISERKKREAWQNFIGASARIPEPAKKRKKSPYGEALAEKFKNMGLLVDYDAD